MENSITSKNGELKMDEITSLYDPKNTYNFVSKKEKSIKEEL